ncbi:MAG: fimbrillin family protein [Bacteroidales bacterium]|nr:fimbrillin family protein [Bacteroidales bacterium]
MKKIVLVLAAALALASCAKQESIRSAQPGEVRFTTNIQTYTVKATDTAFENNDQVGIFAGAPISKNNVQAAVSGTSLIPVTPIKWVDGNNNLVDFVAYYPYAADATLTDYAFAVEANQANLGNYKKSDLMLAKTSSAPVETAVNLAFSHALSKVVITLTNNVPETTVSRVEFEGVAMSAKVNLSTGALSELGAAGTITANAADAAYQLILLPQSASPKVNVFLSNNIKYTYELASAFTFKAGKKASAALVVDPQQEAGAVQFSFTVADWVVDTDALEFGEPTVEEAAAEHTWSVIGTLNEDTWTTDIPMVLTDGKWTATITYAAGDEFKLRADGAWDLSAGIKSDWEGQVFIAGENPDPYLEENSPRNIKLEAAGEYKLEFEYPAYKFVVTKLGGEDPQPAETGKLTVNVYNGPSWNPLYFYAWVEADPWPHFTADWPGTAAAAEDVVVGENAFKSFVMDAAPLNSDNIFYILSDGTDAHKTINLKFPVVLTEAQTTVYLELKPDGSVVLIEDPANFEPTAAPDPAAGPVWAVVGLASDWNTEHEMTQDTEDENLWTITVTLGAEAAEKDGFKFKIKGDTTWATQFGVDATAETNEFEITEADQVVNLVANQGNSKNIIIKPFAYQYKLKLYVDGENKGKLLVTKL